MQLGLTGIVIVAHADDEVRPQEGGLQPHHCCHVGLVILSPAAPVPHLQQGGPLPEDRYHHAALSEVFLHTAGLEADMTQTWRTTRNLTGYWLRP